MMMTAQAYEDATADEWGDDGGNGGGNWGDLLFGIPYVGLDRVPTNSDCHCV